MKALVPAAALLLLSGQAAAQSEAGARERAESEQLRAASEVAHSMEAREAEVTKRLADAERRMAEAARQIAELTSERLPQRQFIERRIEIIEDGRPRLGVTIGGDDEGPVEGVRIVGVTPGSAASEAGLRAGDTITSINNESLSAASTEESTQQLLDFMDGVEEGDTLDVEYLRDGKVGKVEVEPRPVEANVLMFGNRPMGAPSAPNVHVRPGLPDHVRQHMTFNWTGNSWGDMELVELNEGLGRYFGTDDGLLVVSAPESNTLKLEDGDVIQKIDGRTPSSVRHAMRILSSYQGGETLKLEIMRDKKRRTLDVEMPDDRSSMLFPESAPVVRPAAVPAAPRPATPIEKT